MSRKEAKIYRAGDVYYNTTRGVYIVLEKNYAMQMNIDFKNNPILMVDKFSSLVFSDETLLYSLSNDER